MRRHIIILLVMLSSLSCVSAIDAFQHVIFEVSNADSLATYEFNYSTSPDCSSVVSTNITSLASNSNFIVDYYVPINVTAFSEQLNLCIYEDGTLIQNVSVSYAGPSPFASNVSANGIIDDSNITLSNFDIVAKKFFGVFNWIIKLGESSSYLEFNGTELSFNESKLNETIQAIDTDTISNETDLINSVNTTSNIIALGAITNTTEGWTLTFSNIYSKDWSNITIEESQISDLVHTTDTNESNRMEFLVTTDCSSGQTVIGIQDNGTVLCADDFVTSSTLNSSVWLLDGTSAPPTADWDMGGFGFDNVGELNATDIELANRLYHAGDLDTFLEFDSDLIRLYAGNLIFADIVNSTQSTFRINPNQENINTRITGQNDSVLLTTDASSNIVSVGSSTGTHKFNVNGSSNNTGELYVGENITITQIGNYYRANKLAGGFCFLSTFGCESSGMFYNQIGDALVFKAKGTTLLTLGTLTGQGVGSLFNRALLLQDGNYTIPSIVFANEPTTGIRRVGNGVFGFQILGNNSVNVTTQGITAINLTSGYTITNGTFINSVCKPDGTDCPSFTDTNETVRFDNLVATDCVAGSLVIGVQANGTVLCATDSGGFITDQNDELNKTGAPQFEQLYLNLSAGTGTNFKDLGLNFTSLFTGSGASRRWWNIIKFDQGTSAVANLIFWRNNPGGNNGVIVSGDDDWLLTPYTFSVQNNDSTAYMEILNGERDGGFFFGQESTDAQTGISNNQPAAIYAFQKNALAVNSTIKLYTGNNYIGDFGDADTDGSRLVYNLTLNELAGSGNAYVCVDSNGKLFRSSSACV